MDNNQFRRVFIIGAPKCATSSLHSWLVQFPEVFDSSVKETHYFTHENVKKTYYKPALLIQNKSEYQNHFQDASEGQILLDSTPNYLLYPETASKIYKAYPHSKIIAILRHPFERAVSHFKMDRVLGIHSHPLKDINNLIRNNESFRREYLENSMYGQNIERFIKVFPIENMNIIDFDILKKNGKSVLDNVTKFLGITNTKDIEINIQPTNIYNPSGGSYHKLLRKIPFLYPVVRSFPPSIKLKLKEIGSRKSTIVDNLSKEELNNLRHEFMEFLIEDQKTLENLVPWTTRFR